MFTVQALQSSIQNGIIKPSGVVNQCDIHFSWSVFLTNEFDVVQTVTVGKWVGCSILLVYREFYESHWETIP